MVGLQERANDVRAAIRKTACTVGNVRVLSAWPLSKYNIRCLWTYDVQNGIYRHLLASSQMLHGFFLVN